MKEQQKDGVAPSTSGGMRDKSLKVLEEKFKDYFAIGDAITILLHPFAEVVMHDLASGRIVRLWNAFSKRKAGAPSRLEGASDLFTEEDVLGPYEKVLASQGRTKSITAAIRDDAGTIIGYFCINLDITIFDLMMGKMLAFTNTPTERVKPLYLNDFQQQINFVVRDYLISINRTLDTLTRQDRVTLVGQIESSGLFHARNAIRHLATALGISRASVYNLLTEHKNQSESAGGPVSPSTSIDAAERKARADAIAMGQSQAEARPTRRPRAKKSDRA